MFRHFKPEEDLGQQQACKSSAVRAIKQSLGAVYPSAEPYLDALLPKKEGVAEVKGKDKASFIVLDGVPLFFRARDGPYFPTLRVLHAFPDMMPRVTVDAGGTKFIVKGADVMCPGLTSAGGGLPAGLPAGCPVAIYAQGKEHALGVGVLKMSADDIRKVNKGPAVETLHHLGDDLWLHPTF